MSLLTGLEGRQVAARISDSGEWIAGLVKWGGKGGLRIVTESGRRVRPAIINAVVALP